MSDFKKPTPCLSIKPNAGVSLVELMIVVGILGIVFFMTATGVNLITNGAKQKSVLETQRDAQIALYGITRDIRNCADIVSISSDTLTLLIVDTMGGYDPENSPGMFDRTGTLTFKFNAEGNGQKSYLSRTLDFPSFSIHQEQKLLVGLLEQPSEGGYHIFKKNPSLGPDATGDEVRIEIRVTPPFGDSKKRVYRTQVMKRASN